MGDPKEHLVGEGAGEAADEGRLAVGCVPAAGVTGGPAAAPAAAAEPGVCVAPEPGVAPAPARPAPAKPRPAAKPSSPFLRGENEDDDGYDPYSDRPAAPSPLFERDPWS